jgi:WD40 repeat protein/serine/threonine protein kinase
LQALFDGVLDDDKQPDLADHLERCPTCQGRLQALGADSGVWRLATGHLRQGDTPPEPALVRVVARLETAVYDLGRPAEPCPSETRLDFLSPSQRPNGLGRLAHYEVQEVIGHGGMGVVLKAFDERLQRTVAIKVLAAHLAAESAARGCFLREARAVAAVRDEHVIAIHAVEEINGLPYLVMDYVAGGSLQERLDRHGPPGLEETLRIGKEVALGLAAAHARGLVHRDVKPANILLEDDTGKVRLTDFGLARVLADTARPPSGLVAGTPGYMAPEQARGDEADHRADLFGLGSVLYALCTGEPPYPGTNTTALLQQAQTPRPRPVQEKNARVPGWLAAVIARLHAPEPANRFASAAEVAALLGRRRSMRPRWPLALAAAAILGLAAGALLTAQILIRVRDKDGGTTEYKVAENSSITIERGGKVLAKVGPGQGKSSGPQQFTGHSEPVQGLGFSPDGGLIFSGSWDGTIRVWDLESGQQTRLFNLARAVPARTVFWVAFSPDGRRALAATREGDVWLWSLETGRQLRSWKPAAPQSGGRLVVTAVVFSRDGRQALFGCRDGTLLVWDIESWQERARYKSQGTIWHVHLSPDGRHAFSAGERVSLWSLADNKELHRLTGHGNGAWCAVFSPDGRRALSGGGDNDPVMRLWEVDTGKEIRRFLGHARAVKDVAFFRDGRRAVSASFDGTVRLWDLEAGQELRRFPADSDVLHSVALSPDERHVAAAGVNGVLRVWPIPESQKHEKENQ